VNTVETPEAPLQQLVAADGPGLFDLPERSCSDLPESRRA
jgi:hypothetical protein